MKSKVIVWAYLIVLSFGTMLSLYMPKTEAAAKESIVIPGEAIRLRILANSDLDSDQALKRKVRDAVNAQITLWVQDLTSMQKARTIIKEKLPEIKAIAEKVVHEQGSNQTVKVQFGKVQFPTKLYGQFLYPAGEYQAVLITLGKGEGANWWCVLYPPLCFLDFSNGVAVSQGFNEKAQAATNNSDSSDGQDTAAADVKTSGTAAAADEKQNQKTDKEAKNQPVQNSATAVDQGVTDPSAANATNTENVASKEQPTAKQAPVYTVDDEQPVKVKFFIVELWQKLFD